MSEPAGFEYQGRRKVHQHRISPHIGAYVIPVREIEMNDTAGVHLSDGRTKVRDEFG